MLNFDPTPPALPAVHATAAPDSATAPKGAADAFGDLLSLLASAPTVHTPKVTARAGGDGSRVARVIIAPDGATPSLFGLSIATAKIAKAAPATDTAPTATAAAHRDDDQALADNLTWLFSTASAAKPEAVTPAPTTFPGDVAGGTANNATACTGQASDAAAGAVSMRPAAMSSPATPSHGVEPQDADALIAAVTGAGVASAVDAVAPDATGVPGVQPRVPQAAAKATMPSRAIESSAGRNPLSRNLAGEPAASNAPSTAVDGSVAPSTPRADPAASNANQPWTASVTPHAAARETTSTAAAWGEPSKTPVAPVLTHVEAPAVESRLADPGTVAKRDTRGSDERHSDAPLTKLTATAPGGVLFQAPVDARAQPVSTPTAADVVATSRAEIPAEAELPRQIVQAIRLQWSDGVGDARIKLQPDYLGELSIAIRVEHGSVTASLESNSPAVRAWIDNNQPLLRQALAEHGLHLDQLTVKEEQAPPDWTGAEDGKQRQQEDEARDAQRARRRRNADGPAFEMVA